MKKTAWAIFRTILACAVVGGFGFVGYYVLWGINIATEWAMLGIDWIWEFVQNNVFAAVIIVGLVCVGSIILEMIFVRIKKSTWFQKIRAKFTKS